MTESANSPVGYVPILKGKEGEFGALEELDRSSCKNVKPLLEIPPVPFDFVNERPAKALKKHIEKFAGRMEKAWKSGVFFLDMPHHFTDDNLVEETSAIDWLLADCREKNLPVVPVATTNQSAQYRSALKDHVKKTSSGLLLRLAVEDFAEENNLQELVDQILQNILGKSDKTDIDLMVDLKHLGSDTTRDLLVAKSVLIDVPNLREWRSVTLAAASFPPDLSDIGGNSIQSIPRREWNLWQRMRPRFASLVREFQFSDYAISHPDVRELDPRTMRMSASARYTTADHWLVVKGRNVRQYGFDQYFEISRQIVKHVEYAGPDYSWGDQFITMCAMKTAGPGNATTWRKVGTNHHITLVANQLSNLTDA